MAVTRSLYLAFSVTGTENEVPKLGMCSLECIC